jgi:hypothetical protein
MTNYNSYEQYILDRINRYRDGIEEEYRLHHYINGLDQSEHKPLNSFDNLKTYSIEDYKESVELLKDKENSIDDLIEELNNIVKHYKDRLNKEINKYRLIEIFDLEDYIKVFENDFYDYEDIGYCEHCDNDIHNDDLNHLEDHFYCSDCYSEVSRTCNECNSDFHNESDEIQYYECCDYDICDSCNHVISYCEDCESEYYEGRDCNCDDEDYPIKNYSHKPKQQFFKQGNEKTNLFYGLEIETVLRSNDLDLSDIAQKTLNQFETNEIVLKSDGSIGSYGFEIVSNTATFNYHKQSLWNCFFDSDIRDYLKSFHVQSCGLHIHASRDFYSKLDIGKLVVFLNLPYNKNFLVKLCGRDYNSYCRHNPKKTFKDIKGYERFEILNLTNSKTIEFRLFKGNLKRQSVFRYLEFVDSLSHFVKEIKLQTNNLKFWHFIKWFRNNPISKKKYNNLYSYLEKKKYFEILDTKIIFIKNDNVRQSK